MIAPAMGAKRTIVAVVGARPNFVKIVLDEVRLG
jgi:hypothetical protein